MKATTRNLLVLALITLTTQFALAQPGWNWGDSVDKAKEKNALYTDYMKANNYESALNSLQWLLKNTPDLNASIYINGAKIYEGLAESTSDEAKTLEYQGKALEMYDLRIKYFNDEADVLNRKALTAYKYYKDNKPKYKELYELFTRTFELNGNSIYSSNLTAYMDVIRRYKLTGGDISDEEVFEIYTKVTDVIEHQMENGGNKARLEKVSEYVDKLLTATVDVDCEFVEEKLGPKFRETQDINLAKKIFSLMLQQKCTDSPLAMDVAIAINEESPTYGIAKFIGAKAAAEEDYEKAEQYFKKAAELTEDNTKKSEVYLSLARVQTKQSKVKARNTAREAISFDPSNSEAYIFIGDLYFTSFEDCKGGESRLKDRAVFLAAYEMYQRGGDRQKMASAKAQFPSIEDIFSEGKEEGQTVTVDCWINETVEIERRPAN